MLRNLPKEFPIKKLEKFDFGGVEAKTDNLIENILGFCWTRPIYEFVKGKKNIVIGERGSGKSVLFRLLKEKKLQFMRKEGNVHITLPIEEELQYATLRDYLEKHVATFTSNPSMKYRIAWELFILTRILNCLSEEYGASLPEELKIANNEMSVVLGYKKDSVRLIEIVKNVKATIGVKFGSSYVGTIEPSLYGSVEQKDATGSGGGKGASERNIDIDAYKRSVQKFLKSRSHYLFVLVDKVDEFVIKGDYDVQKLVLQALMETEMSYMDYKNIRFKLFIRCDLFKRLEYDVLGPDKILAKKIELVWRDEDIRRLIAQRIMFNYANVIGLTSIPLYIDNNKLYVDEKSIESELDQEVQSNQESFFKKAKKFIKRIFDFRLAKDSARQLEGRHTTLNDEISQQIITSIFPKKVKHTDRSGKSNELDIFDYLSTHFSLASGTTTPRLIIMFLDKCIEIATDYYRNNSDEKVPLDSNNEYPLFKRRILILAYEEFQKEVSSSFSNISSTWKPYFDKFITKKGKKVDYKFTEIHKVIGGDIDEAKRFIAFMCNIGYLKCHNPKGDAETRECSLPILFQR